MSVCARHLALSYKQGTAHCRNNDAAISHSSPFPLLVNKPKAVHILYSCRSLSSGAHMKALGLCFALACFQCQTDSGLPQHTPQTPALGGQPAGSHAACSLGLTQPLGCLPCRAREDPSLSVRSVTRPPKGVLCWGALTGCGIIEGTRSAPCTCLQVAGAPGNGGARSQSCSAAAGR